jgi:hypothetical protein
MSHFSNRWGLVCDNVKNMEVRPDFYHNGFLHWVAYVTQVVLADSRIVQANTYENPDLFRALKGGGANFGRGEQHPMEQSTNADLFQAL